MQIEIGELERKYASLRISDPARQSRLTASISEHGQQTPVLVVPQGAAGYVLIDGYRRVAALEALACDVVEAQVLSLSEPEALILSHRFEATRLRSALEEAWLLRELVEVHGRSQAELALALQRSVSWISRRLALVRALPESIQSAVRGGQIPPQAAMKFLVPLARAKRSDATKLVERLEGRRISVRQVETLYLAWRRGDREQRQRLIERPWLYLKAAEEAHAPQPIPEVREDDRLEQILEGLVALGHQARRRLRRGVLQRVDERQRRSLRAGWRQVELVMASVARLMEDGEDHEQDARSANARDDSSAARTGSRDPGNLTAVACVEELGAARSA
jgi:ParB family chromosome partitioning protein